MANVAFLIRILIPTFSLFILFKYFSLYIALLGMVSVAYFLLKEFGFIGKIEIRKFSFYMSTAYIKDYRGPYNKSYIAYNAANKILKHDKSKRMTIIGLYFDKADLPNPRYSVGFLFKKKHFEDKIDGDFKSFLISEGYKEYEFPSTLSLYSSWTYSNLISMFNGIKKFYDTLNKKLDDFDFISEMKLNKNFTPKVCIEEYVDSEINFFVPLNAQDKFLVYGGYDNTEHKE